jgi:predicted small integral membrane protein
MSEILAKRAGCIIMALFPALWGIFGFLNNVSDFRGTAEHAVAPLLSMQDTYGVADESWRAITTSWAPYVGLGMITAMEAMAGMLALIGVFIMILNFRQNYDPFAKGKVWAMLGALCAISVWGLGFMVVAGDWFMAWQAAKNPLNTQLGAMLYALPCMIAILVMMIHKEER